MSEWLAIECRVDELCTQGFVLRRDLERTERVRRSARSVGICFAVAFLTLFIPILHFILPPLFLIVGGVFATTTYLETSQIESGEIHCPNCKQPMELRRQTEEWPKLIRCDGCSYSLTLSPAGALLCKALLDSGRLTEDKEPCTCRASKTSHARF